MADHENSRIKHSDHLLLDQPLLRLPHELLRKNFRAAHFAIEKDTSSLKSLLKDSATAALSGRASQQDVLKNLDSMISRMRGVKRKLGACAEEEGRLHEQTAARIQHLNELYTMQSVDDVKYEAWSRKRLDRLLTDYLLRHGYNNSARELASEKGMENLVDVETFVSMSRIREALLNQSVVEALAWCTENKKELRKMESKLEFMLRLQQYIELIRTQSEPKLACGLLAIPPDGTTTGIYSDLYKASRWNELADVFTSAHNSLLALPSVPLLHVALSSGLSALKTPACHSSHLDEAYNEAGSSTLGHGVCPICSTELNDLARNVPYAHHTKSHVEHDLFLLPNGRVYGKERLDDYARKSGLPPSMVKDPITGEVFFNELLKKVFIT
ncbi:hypothetical protein TrVGV298_010386 [Trichoderma virens]|nr:hypothetical protein TrVGV298_010386 [Trichoderma virens]